MGIPVDSSPTSPSNCTTSSAALPSPPANSSPPSDPCPRCQGLDLLAMAALHVGGVAKEEESNNNEGSHKNSNNNKLVVDMKVEVGIGGVEFGTAMKRRRRQALMPSKYQDSVLQPWKRGSRRRRPPARRLG